MSLISYTVRRNVEAEDKDGNSVKIALALVKHENGAQQAVAIREDLIRFEGEGVIEREVKRAAAMPSTYSLN